MESFLTHLAAERQLSPSSHRQALSPLLFLYSKVLGQQLPWMQDIGRPVPKPRLPVVLSREEVQVILSQMAGVHVDVATTMIYTHVLRMGGGAVQSPLDSLHGTEVPQSSRRRMAALSLKPVLGINRWASQPGGSDQVRQTGVKGLRNLGGQYEPDILPPALDAAYVRPVNSRFVGQGFLR